MSVKDSGTPDPFVAELDVAIAKVKSAPKGARGVAGEPFMDHLKAIKDAYVARDVIAFMNAVGDFLKHLGGSEDFHGVEGESRAGLPAGAIGPWIELLLPVILEIIRRLRIR